MLPQYSGGLGILAGDHLKAASDLGVPIIGVGLLYRAGYFPQSLSRDGWQLERYPSPRPARACRSRAAARSPTASRCGSRSSLPDSRTLHAQVWVAQVGRVPLLLLDSDIEDNDADARQVTDRLYGGNAEHRLEQELLLGVGGVRAIRAYCAATGAPQPEVFHTNEGHAGFLGVERIRELVEAAGLDFDEALRAVRAGTVFTTHTPVPAGIDRFPRDLIEPPRPDMAGSGGCRCRSASRSAPRYRATRRSSTWPHMGLRLGQRANGVSLLHGAVSRDMFHGLWPGFDTTEVPITLGHQRRARPDLDVAGRWSRSPTAHGGGDAECAGRRRALGRVAQGRRRELWGVRAICASGWWTSTPAAGCGRPGRSAGLSEAELGWIGSAFDPDVLTIGFARRVPSYKRLTLMLRDPERLRALLLDPERPVQIVIAGKSPPGRRRRQAAHRSRWCGSPTTPAVRHRIAFLPDYDIGMARSCCGLRRLAEQPAAPARGLWDVRDEGCAERRAEPVDPATAGGTSGSTATTAGPSRPPTAVDPDRRDDLEATALYDLMALVAPDVLRPGDDGVPSPLGADGAHTLRTLGPKVLATRMVAEYVRPTLPAGRALVAGAARPGGRSVRGGGGADRVEAARRAGLAVGADRTGRK